MKSFPEGLISVLEEILADVVSGRKLYFLLEVVNITEY